MTYLNYIWSLSIFHYNENELCLLQRAFRKNCRHFKKLPSFQKNKNAKKKKNCVWTGILHQIILGRIKCSKRFPYTYRIALHMVSTLQPSLPTGSCQLRYHIISMSPSIIFFLNSFYSIFKGDNFNLSINHHLYSEIIMSDQITRKKISFKNISFYFKAIIRIFLITRDVLMVVLWNDKITFK